MEFTELYKHSANLVAFSPGAQFILNAVHDRLIVRRADTFEIRRTWLVDTSPSSTIASFATDSTRSSARGAPGTPAPHPDAYISHIGWSCDSEYILGACAKRGVVAVFKMHDESWNARIEVGTEGLVKAEWTPDGRTVICFSEWGLRVTLWSLVTGAATYIQYPKHPDRGYAFRPDGRYFIVAERHKSKDTLGVYDTADSYKQVRHYTVPTANLASIAVSPTGNHVAVWEGTHEYKLCVLTLPGTLLATFSPEPDPGLGIRCVAWHPSGSFLAVGGYDDKIYILDGLSWSPVATLELTSRIPSTVTVWREPSGWLEATRGRGFLSYERPQGSHTVPIMKADASKAHPKSGLIQLEWNTTGSLLLARFETAPTAAFIYNFPAPSEPFRPRLRSVLLQAKPVLHARWNPNPARPGSLVLCCGGGGMYTWSNEWASDNDADEDTVRQSVSSMGSQEEEMAECIGVPAAGKFQLRDIRWAPDGKRLILIDTDTFCGAFEVDADG